MGKLLGYNYRVVEFFPSPDAGDTSYHILTQRDNVEDAQKIVDVLHNTDYNFGCYGIVLHPVYVDG